MTALCVSWIGQARTAFHKRICTELLSISDTGIASIADRGSAPSVAIAAGLVEALGGAREGHKVVGQQAGAVFEKICADYLATTLAHLDHLRSGLTVSLGGVISDYDQYAHLERLEALASAHPEMRAALGAEYLIKPDVVVSRAPLMDARLNADAALVGGDAARLTSLRGANQGLPILHASVSCKWTLRSDRAQNARSEALNLVRNRKGRVPHIVAVTAEPLPGRIASLALGTGDIDCTYHFALDELRDVLVTQNRTDALALLDTMIAGKRLRDISDLPFDLVT